MKTLVAAKGRSVTTIRMATDDPDDATIESLVLGPTGNLRAPTLKVGARMVVGYHADMYADVFGV